MIPSHSSHPPLSRLTRQRQSRHSSPPLIPSITAIFLPIIIIIGFLLPLAHALPPLALHGYVTNVRILDRRGGRVSADSPLTVKLELDFNVASTQKSQLLVQSFRFQLEPNTDLLSHDIPIIRLTSDGKFHSEEIINRAEQKVFRGNVWLDHLDKHGATQTPTDGVWHRPVGAARVSIRRDGENPLLEGSFDIAGQIHHIQIDGETMIFFRNADLLSDNSFGHDYGDGLVKRGQHVSGTCGSDSLSFNTDQDHPVHQNMRRDADMMSRIYPRQDIAGAGNSLVGNIVSSIGSSAGCPSTRKVALVGVATDCTYSALFNSTDSLRNNIITQFNSASAIFERTFNISLGLHTLVTSDVDCPGTPPASAPWNQPCSSQVTIQDRLSLFSEWRSQRGDDGQSHWTLLTTCQTDTAVGLAWLGQACMSDSVQTNGTDGIVRNVSGANVVVKTDLEWQVLAHETGHTFGAVHDCTLDTCNNAEIMASQGCCPLSSNTCDAKEQYIMNPSTVLTATDFSPCTLGNVCSSLGHNSVKSSCFTNNRDVSIITGPVCGNGIVEVGEECDCGGKVACGNNPCCDGTTCKLIAPAVCDDSNDDCCDKCQFATAGTICRAANGVCDPAETCPGNNSSCPSNVVIPDGSKCGNSTDGNLKCASGQCTSRDQQCKSVMGSDKTACDTSGCVLTCTTAGMSSIFGTTCVSLNQNFLDGTPCSGNGKCQNGICAGASLGGEVAEWFRKNKSIAIPVVTIGGLLILLGILSCLWHCCRRNKRQTTRLPRGGVVIPNNMPPMRGAPPGFVPKFNAPTTHQPPPFDQNMTNGGGNGWSNPSIGGSTLNANGGGTGIGHSDFYPPPYGSPPAQANNSRWR